MKKREKLGYEFDSFRIDVPDGTLLRHGKRLPLEAKSFDVLLVLVKNRDRKMSLQTIREKVWNNSSTPVNDSTVTRYVAKIKRRLNDPRGIHARYIRNDHKGNYQFIASPVRETGKAKTIAVIPFRNQSTRKSDIDIGSVIAEVLIARFTKLKRFDVIPSAKSSVYNSSNLDPLEVGEELRADFVVSGTIIQLGRQTRVIMYLHDVSEEREQSSEMFHESNTSLFETLDSISKRAIDALVAEIEGEESERTVKRYTESSEALRQYDWGISYLQQRTPDALQRGLKCFQLAAKADQEFSLAHVGIADCNLLLCVFGSEVLPPRKGMPEAEKAIRRALSIDDTLAEAYATLGAVKFLFHWDWFEAEKDFERAIRDNPEYATAHQWYAHNLAYLGRFDDALYEIGLAAEHSPASPIVNATMSRIHYLAGNYDKAIELAESTIALNKHFFLGHLFLAIAYNQLDRAPDAVIEIRKALDLDPQNPASLGELGHALSRSGEPQKAKKVISQLKELSKHRYIGSFNFAKIYLGLNDLSETFAYLEKAFRERSGWLVSLKMDPIFGDIRRDPRFRNLIERVGLS